MRTRPVDDARGGPVIVDAAPARRAARDRTIDGALDVADALATSVRACPLIAPIPPWNGRIGAVCIVDAAVPEGPAPGCGG